MSTWWTSLKAIDRAFVVVLFATAAVTFFVALPLSNGYWPNHLVTFGMGFFALASALSVGVRGAGVRQWARNISPLAYVFFGAAAGILLCGFLLMDAVPVGL